MSHQRLNRRSALANTNIARMIAETDVNLREENDERNRFRTEPNAFAQSLFFSEMSKDQAIDMKHVDDEKYEPGNHLFRF